MDINMKETLQSKITECIQEQLLLNGITDFKVIDGNFKFTNNEDKSRANNIIHDYLTFLLDDKNEFLM